jgi:hypothetical protein
MSRIFTHVPHPRFEQRKASGPAKVQQVRGFDHPNPLVRTQSSA